MAFNRDDLDSALSDGDGTAGAAPTRRLRNPVREQFSWFRRATTASLLLAIAVLPPGIAAICHPDPSGVQIGLFVAAVVVSSTSLFLGIVLICLLSAVRRYDSDLAALESGAALVHWTYAPEDWSAFVADEIGEASQIAKWTVIPLSVVGGLIGALMAWKGASVYGSGLLLWLMIFLGASLIGLPLGAMFQTVSMRRCRRWQAEVGETLIGPNGLYFAGEYQPWSFLGQELVGVEQIIDRKPRVLAFRFRMPSNHGSTYHTVNVPVPTGAEDLAEAIANRLASV